VIYRNKRCKSRLENKRNKQHCLWQAGRQAAYVNILVVQAAEFELRTKLASMMIIYHFR